MVISIPSKRMVTEAALALERVTNTAASQSYTNQQIALIPAGGGGTGSGSRVSSATVYASNITGQVQDTAAGVWVCDGIADEVQINAAITAVGRGRVQLIGQLFNITGSILLKTGVWLAGEGLGTIVRAASDFGLGMVRLFDETIHATTLSDLSLDGATRGVTAGVHYNCYSGQVFTSEPSTNPDSAHIVTRLNIMSIGNSTVVGHGMRLRGDLRASKYSEIRILNASGNGVWVEDSADMHFTNVEVGSSGDDAFTYSVARLTPQGHGFFVDGSNNMFTTCKSWYSRGTGFYNRGPRNQYSNCQAQDNYSHGFEAFYGRTSFVGCHADSNGQGLGTAARGTAGFRVITDYVTLSGCVSHDRGQAWGQTHGYSFTTAFANGRVSGCIAALNTVAEQTGEVGVGTTVDINGMPAVSNGFLLLGPADPIPGATPSGTLIFRTS